MPNRQLFKLTQLSFLISMSLTQIIQIFFCHTIYCFRKPHHHLQRKYQITSVLSPTSRAFASFAIDIRDLSVDY